MFQCRSLCMISGSLLMLISLHAVASRQAPLQIAFGIMVFQRENELPTATIAQFNRLMSLIYEDESNHIYIIHADLKSDRGIHEYLDQEWCGPKENCLPIYPRDISWGGITVVEMNMALMQAADEFQYRNGSQSHWDYFVLLGHESVPLATLQYTEQFLLSYPAGTNFINCWHYSGYDFFGQWEDVVRRLSDVVIDNFAGGQQHEGFEIRRPVPFGMDIYKTIQYVVLSRDFIRYALHGSETRRILIFLANVKASDELIMPTILHTSAEFAATATCDTTLHFTHWIRPGGSWSPEYLTLEHLPLILNTSSHLFARKIHNNRSDILLEALAHLRKDELLQFPYDKDVKVTPETAIKPTVEADIAEARDGKNEVRVRPLYPQKPLLSDKSRVNSWEWLIPLGTKHFQSIYEDEDTPESVLEAVAQSALHEGIVDHHVSSRHAKPKSTTTVGAKSGVQVGVGVDGRSDTASSQKASGGAGGGVEPTPYQMMMMLDTARRAREEIEKENFFRFLEEYWRYMQEKEKQEEMHKQNQAKFSELASSWKR